ncbi:MAG: fumarylacetoacetase [Phycisphaerales bacterium]|nr:fumarylacetoacetase [Phycisphaerales bacterium]
MNIDHTHNSSLTSWVKSASAEGCDFTIQNLPFGIFRGEDGNGRIGVAIGDQILDVQAAIADGALELPGDTACALCAATLNAFMGQGASSWRVARHAISALLSSEAEAREGLLHPMEGAEMLLPASIGDYTDFYAARHHATNVGRMFRPDGDPLLPNYLHLPVGYHGRASSVVVSGTPIRRPLGQLKPDDGDPIFGPCRLLDHELEFAAFVGPGNQMGTRIDIADAMDHIFGIVILNDWSARDIQKWEYQPLGPFNAKNFASSISPWVVTIDALAPYRRSGPDRQSGDPDVLEYLKPVTDDVLDVVCEASLASADMRQQGAPAHRLSHGNLGDLTWSFAQMLAHHTSTGCPMHPGDLLGSGTISGPQEDARGCMLELTWRGTNPVQLPDGTERKFLLDGDELTINAWCEAEGAARIGFGSCSGVIEPAG